MSPAFATPMIASTAPIPVRSSAFQSTVRVLAAAGDGDTVLADAGGTVGGAAVAAEADGDGAGVAAGAAHAATRSEASNRLVNWRTQDPPCATGYAAGSACCDVPSESDDDALSGA